MGRAVPLPPLCDCLVLNGTAFIFTLHAIYVFDVVIVTSLVASQSRVRLLTRTRDFSLLNFHTGSGARPIN